MMLILAGIREPHHNHFCRDIEAGHKTSYSSRLKTNYNVKPCSIAGRNYKPWAQCNQDLDSTWLTGDFFGEYLHTWETCKEFTQRHLIHIPGPFSRALSAFSEVRIAFIYLNTKIWRIPQMGKLSLSVAWFSSCCTFQSSPRKALRDTFRNKSISCHEIPFGKQFAVASGEV